MLFRQQLSFFIRARTYFMNNCTSRQIRWLSSKAKRRKGNPRKQNLNQDASRIRNQLQKQNMNVSKKPLPPITKVVQSPAFQKKMIGKIKDFQKDVQEAVLPDFMKQGELSVRKREPVVMDAKWWCVNIAIACAPALLIQLVCMYKQDDMIEFYKQQQLLQNGGVQSGIQSRNMGNETDAIVQPTDDSSWETTKSKSVLDAAAALFGFKNVVQDESDISDTNETRSTEEESSSTTPTKIDLERKEHHISDPKSYSQLVDNINSLEQQIKELKGHLSVQHDEMVVNTYDGQNINENVTPATEDEAENKVEVRTVTADSMKDFFSSQLERRKDAISDTAKDTLVQIQQTLMGNSANDEEVQSDTHEVNTMDEVSEVKMVSDNSKPDVVATHDLNETSDNPTIGANDTQTKDKTKRWYHRLNIFRSKQNKR